MRLAVAISVSLAAASPAFAEPYTAPDKLSVEPPPGWKKAKTDFAPPRGGAKRVVGFESPEQCEGVRNLFLVDEVGDSASYSDEQIEAMRIGYVNTYGPDVDILESFKREVEGQKQLVVEVTVPSQLGLTRQVLVVLPHRTNAKMITVSIKEKCWEDYDEAIDASLRTFRDLEPGPPPPAATPFWQRWYFWGAATLFLAALVMSGRRLWRQRKGAAE